MGKFTLKNIDCELGVSVEINKVWYRLSSKVGSDCTGPATLSEIRERLNSIKSDLSPLIQKQKEDSSIFLISKIKTILTKVCDKLSQF